MRQVPRLGQDPFGPFPETTEALDNPNGLLAWGGDLHPARLLNAYRRGIFPWSSAGEPLLWWSPAPRCVLYPESLHVSRRLRRRLRQRPFRTTADRDFDAVVAGCAEPAPGRESTWITPELATAFHGLHRLGHAHSIEVWHPRHDDLLGGLYGLALGRAFFAESMFHRADDASNVALWALCGHLRDNGFRIIDCQVDNPHLIRMGATLISRERFEKTLKHALTAGEEPGSWRDRFRDPLGFR